jgi:beta-glucosidase
MTNNRVGFPSDFTWGAATASYQIEGAWNADGKGLSIWDTFAHTPGKIEDGSNGDIACDHYRLWREDISILRELGLNAYRFSISWPRILPEGRGAVNQLGLDFYDRLVEKLLYYGITPWITLYHWDLPQLLQDKGGWVNRDTAYAFAEFAGVVADRLGDRVKNWITLNEPWCSAVLGYFTGDHAPGHTDTGEAVTAGHHLLLAHGLAVPVLRERSEADTKVGVTLNFTPGYPADETQASQDALKRHELFINRWFIHPIFKGGYPPEFAPFLEMYGVKQEPDDAKTIAVPLDFLGINNYTRELVTEGEGFPPLNFKSVKNDKARYTEMGWEVYPEGLYDLLTWLKREYNPPAIYITENGAAFADTPEGDYVQDHERVDYLAGYISQVNRAMEHGVPVKGYFVWSLMDNFEWAFGYTKRFGIIYVDFATQRRLIKDSGLWFKNTIAANGFEK